MKDKEDVLLRIIVVAALWAYPFYYAIRHDARGMEDLNRVSQVMVIAGFGLFLVLMLPLFRWMWFKLKSIFK
jgi:hypothetical protein